MRILELQEQLVVARELALIQAAHDSLTGLFNRAAILSVFEKELARTAREGDPVTLMMADIDDFKCVNDTYGHAAGDTVLRETARRMQELLRPYDSIGRYGGEEFLVVAPGCDLDGGVKLAERLREFVCSLPIHTGEVAIAITMSMGVAVARDSAQSSQLLRAADNALYAAKNAGRNRVGVA